MAKRSRRRDSWGSITYDPKRRVGYIRYWASTDERGYMRHCKTVHGSRQDVEEERARLLITFGKDKPVPNVRYVWETWCLPDIERLVENGDMAPLTRRSHEKSWRLYIKPRWGDVALDQVRPLQIQQWILTMGASPAEGAVSTMARIMDYAVRYELVQHNPMREKYMMPSKSTISRADKGVWKLQELSAVWERVYGQWWEPAFILAAFAGCRLGESLAPLAGDVELVDVDGVDITLVPITGQLASTGNKIVKPKTPQSVRTVVVAGRAARRLKEIADSMPPDWPLSNNGFGERYPQARLKDTWRKMRMEHPYRNLRNGWQTYMRWDLKVEPHYIEVMMGHKVAGITGAHYDRPDREQFARVVADAYRKNRYDEGWDWLSREK